MRQIDGLAASLASGGGGLLAELLLHKLWQMGIVVVVAVLALIAMVIIWRKVGGK
ncbi:hypothetical protein [Streptoalloteichus hindustanus]|uniref:Uncharacterized protein n=1 Tax=Streptoalloteichus hindustanus TaxID=2017 RepID=A0A1M5F8I2_STRHI|nr:hypothetical protein [Streptoalloteichus hindustanus]SHF87412.1 hypothetical protein SAMN05444320_105305 [Streptoalloteichus hindustanus]